MKYIIDSKSLTAIADAIREKIDSKELIKIENMPLLITSIKGGENLEGIIDINVNGTYDVSKMATAVVNVPQDNILPQLYAPNISRNGDTISISNPSSNGSFNKKYKIYNVGENILEQTSSSFSIKTLPVGKYSISVTCNADHFYESAKSTIIDAKVCEIINELVELTKSNNDTKMADGLTYSSTLTPSHGWWLPEFIELYVDDKISLDYTWNMYSGLITYPNVQGSIKIIASALEEPKLKTPVIEYAEKILNLDLIRYAMYYDIEINGQLATTWEYQESQDYSVQSIASAQYGFELVDGYYTPKNYHVQNSYAICRIIFELEFAKTFKMSYIQSSEANYDFALISNIDTALTLSNSIDSSVLKSFKGVTQTTPATYDLSIPAGSHFVDIKYRKDSSGDTGLDVFKFKFGDGGMLADILASATISIKPKKYIATITNIDYVNKKTYNCTYEIYFNDKLIYNKKEGV